MIRIKRNRYKPVETGSVRISGTFKGEIIGAENVVVTTTGSCTCSIHAKKLYIDGTVVGNIDVETLIINSGRLYYDKVKTNRILMAENGFIAHVSDTAVKRIPKNWTADANEDIDEDVKESIRKAVGTYRIDSGTAGRLENIRLYINNNEKEEELKTKDTKEYLPTAAKNKRADKDSGNDKKEFNVGNTAPQFYSSY
jgi:cytoskeletal protein CcmA (bactofilin family)